MMLVIISRNPQEMLIIQRTQVVRREHDSPLEFDAQDRCSRHERLSDMSAIETEAAGVWGRRLTECGI